MNYYHKPQLSLNHLWAAKSKLVVSNVLYASLGNGGGTGITPSVALSGYDENRQIDFQRIYDNNSGNTRDSFFGDISIDPIYSTTEHKSSQFLRSSINNHRWYGLLSTYNYQPTIHDGSVFVTALTACKKTSSILTAFGVQESTSTSEVAHFRNCSIGIDGGSPRTTS